MSAASEPVIATASEICLILWGSFVLAMLLVVCAKGTKAPLKAVMAEPVRFDLKSSWISNVTVFGALLGVGLKDVVSNAGTLGGMSLLFGAMVVTAPLVALATEQSRIAMQYTSVRAFLGYVVLVLWGAFGQVFTLAALVCKAGESYLLFPPRAVFLGIIAVAGIAAGSYAWKSMKSTLEHAVSPEPDLDAALRTSASTARRERLLL